MGRLIFIPQYPSNMRYQEWWIHEFQQEFKKYFKEVKVIGLSYFMNHDPTKEYARSMFAPMEQSIDFELSQMNDYMELHIDEDDTLFLADLSFPGLFSNVLYHKPCPKSFAFCHATSLNKHDYFSDVKVSKFKNETSHSLLYDKIFFGSHYSMEKTKWKNGFVVGLPEPPHGMIYKYPGVKRDIDIVSVSRPSKQKVNLKTERYIEKSLGFKIHRENVTTWQDYSKLLSKSKILLITTKEDTFNYSILDAVRCGCIPLVPDSLCFPEILPAYYRYKTKEELRYKITNMLKDDHFILPNIICQNRVDNFYKTICKIMLED